MTAAQVCLFVLFAAIAGWLALVGLAHAARALGRRLPDEGLDRYRLGVVQKYGGFDPRPEMLHRREQIVREIRQLQSHKKHLDRRLDGEKPARPPVSIADARRAG